MAHADRPYFDPITERAIGESTFEARVLDYAARAEDAQERYESLRYALDVEGVGSDREGAMERAADQAWYDYQMYDTAAVFMEAQAGAYDVVAADYGTREPADVQESTEDDRRGSEPTYGYEDEGPADDGGGDDLDVIADIDRGEAEIEPAGDDFGELADYMDDFDELFDLWDLDPYEAYDEWEFGAEYEEA